MTIYRPSPEEFSRMVEEEFRLSADDQSRVAKFAFGDEQSLEKNWAVIALSTKQLLEVDYRDGQISFYDMLEAMRKLSLGLPSRHRMYFLGAIAEFGLKTRQEPKEKMRGQHDFPMNPRWLKRTILDVFDMAKSINPHLANFSETDDCVYKLTAKFFDELQIPFPAYKTLQGWQGDPQFRDIQEYRFTKKTRLPDDI